ncbi:MAG TPA: hypothetical protein VG324_15240 [Blastocatellia bacterium]|nr:hypothetical protein [Blastocatellia bacterium]
MSGKALRLIQPVSKRDQVVTSFKEAILSGIIQPGDAIVESKVAQQLGAGFIKTTWPSIANSGRSRGTSIWSNVWSASLRRCSPSF